MSSEVHSKVQSRHLTRNAYLYVRQSTLRQVLENTESTRRQYDLRQRAVALGWAVDQIIVLDGDLGVSGASAVDREGFQTLVTEVSLGRAGIVMGLEVSRLARNCADWHRLLEICALTDTLILDDDGIYDPAHFNDRLLLGLKGTMSEAELHVLRARLQGGILNKARRGELRSRLPIGFVYDEVERVVLDPDQQVQDAIRLLFTAFRRTGSALATVKVFRKEGIRFPRRPNHGPSAGEVLWGDLVHSRTLWILHNPRYGGAFFYGRGRQRGHGKTRRMEKLPREDWTALIPNAHEGYVSWKEFEEIQERLRENSAAYGQDRRKSPVREGPALLQGIVNCGRCGLRMSVRYHQRKGRLHPEYTCQRKYVQRGEPRCQSIPGTNIDRAIGKLLVEAVAPMALEVALSVHAELQARINEADALRKKSVERCQYEAELARRRYMSVDPNNRLVAGSLEAEWNEKLRSITKVQEEYEHQRQADRALIDEETREQVLALATDFPRLWRDPATPDRERKRMARLLIEDVTLVKDKEVVAHVRFRGGTTRTLTCPIPPNAWQIRQTDAELVSEIDRLLEHHTDGEIANLLGERGFLSGEGKPLHRAMIGRLRRAYRLKSRHDRLREAGLLTGRELAELLGIAPSTLKEWRRRGSLRALAYSDKPDYLYEPPGEDAPVRYEWQKRQGKVAPLATNEVQCEA